MYAVKFEDKARRQIHKHDKFQQVIIKWIRKNLEGCGDPRVHGKPLTANHSGKWRYRIGDYRALAHIADKEITIYILEVGHRKDVY